jgi:hypothetical protein
LPNNPGSQLHEKVLLLAKPIITWRTTGIYKPGGEVLRRRAGRTNRTSPAEGLASCYSPR